MTEREDADRLLEAERAKLLYFLRETCHPPSIGTVRSFVASVDDAIERYILATTRRLIASQSFLRLKGSDEVLSGSDGQHYMLATASDLRPTASFNITLLPVGGVERSRPATRHRTIDHTGRYSEVTVCLPSDLSDSATVVVEAARMLLTVGYSWARNEILNAATAAEVVAGTALYRQLRQGLPEEELSKQVWFATIGPAYGFRLMDPTVVSTAFDVIRANLTSEPVNPLDVLAALLETRLPRYKTLMQRAAAEGKTINVDVRDAPYAQEGDYYAFVLTTLYGGTSFTIMPLYVREAVSVFALYPTGNELVERRLEGERDGLAAIAATHGAEIIEAVSLFDEKSTADETELRQGTLEVQRLHGLWRELDAVAQRAGARTSRPLRWRHRTKT